MTKKTIEQAYEELRQIIDGGSESFTHDDAVQYLKDRFAQPEQEPVARSDAYDMIDRFLQNNLNSDADYAEYSKALDSIYTTPPQRKPLTDEQADKILETAEKVNPKYAGWVGDQRRAYVRAGYNAAHGIKE